MCSYSLILAQIELIDQIRATRYYKSFVSTIMIPSASMPMPAALVVLIVVEVILGFRP